MSWFGAMEINCQSPGYSADILELMGTKGVILLPVYYGSLKGLYKTTKSGKTKLRTRGGKTKAKIFENGVVYTRQKHESEGVLRTGLVYTRQEYKDRNIKAKNSKDRVMEGGRTWLRALYPWRLIYK